MVWNRLAQFTAAAEIGERGGAYMAGLVRGDGGSLKRL